MPSPAICLAVIGCVTFLCMTSASAIAQGGPPPQVLPDGIRGGSESYPSKGWKSASTCSRRQARNCLFRVCVVESEKAPKAPLILALRGYTGTTLTFVRGTAVDLAEKAATSWWGPGYNNRAGFGVQARPRAGDRLQVRLPAAQRHRRCRPRRPSRPRSHPGGRHQGNRSGRGH